MIQNALTYQSYSTSLTSVSTVRGLTVLPL